MADVYESELEEGEIQEFRSLVKYAMSIPLPLTPLDTPEPSLTPSPKVEEQKQEPTPIAELGEDEREEIKPNWCGCSQRPKRSSWLEVFISLL